MVGQLCIDSSQPDRTITNDRERFQGLGFQNLNENTAM
jgi:hypothetical protein